MVYVFLVAASTRIDVSTVVLSPSGGPFTTSSGSSEGLSSATQWILTSNSNPDPNVRPCFENDCLVLSPVTLLSHSPASDAGRTCDKFHII